MQLLGSAPFWLFDDTISTDLLLLWEDTHLLQRIIHQPVRVTQSGLESSAHACCEEHLSDCVVCA